MTRLLAVLLTAAVAAAQPPKPVTHQIKLDGHTFTLPTGFTVERVAGPPLVDRPIVASFDDRGRLYVADSSGSNEKTAEQLKNPTHRIVRLEDTDGDGKFDKSTVFADKMMFPEGILWHRGLVYVAAPPHIWKLTDADDDGKAEKRDIWFDGKTLTGCANDLHGPYLGPDGWIYWCKGAFAKQEYTLPTGKKFTTRASHIFRARPDGTGIEPVMTGGMDNPVDVAFLPNGERFFTTTFFQHPAAGQRDGLIHAVYGGIYGKDHEVTRDPDHKWTSPNLMPVMTHMGPAAPCGLHCYESDAFGKAYTSNLFACQFNLRKVSRHVLKPKGATYETVDSDFLVSDNTDFHPTDVIEDADGSLLVVDTGGWYKLCCPSSQLVKADVLGAIYRVRRIDALKAEDPLGRKIDWAKAIPARLVGLLNDARPAVRQRTIDELSQRDDDVIDLLADAVRKGEPARVRQNALWSLLRRPTPGRELDALTIKNTLFFAMDDTDAGVRQVALHGIALRRDETMGKVVIVNLLRTVDDKRLVEARITAEALGRIRVPAAVNLLLLSLGIAEDQVLHHALTYALIEIGDVKLVTAALEASDAKVRRGVLTALDQLGEKLDSKVVLEAMKGKDADLRETAAWIVGRHPEWAGEVAKLIQDFEHLPVGVLPILQRFARTPAIEKVMLDTLLDPGASTDARGFVLDVMRGAGGRELPAAWATAIGKAMSNAGYENVIDAVKSLRAFPPLKVGPPDLVAALKKVIDDEKMIPPVRIAAMAVFPGGFKDVTDKHFRILLASVDREEDAKDRGTAVEALSLVQLSTAQLNTLIAQLPKVSPLDLDRVLTAFARTKDDEIGRKLLSALHAPELRPALRADQVKERIKHFGPAIQKEAESLYAALNADHEKQRAKLDETMKVLVAGDIRRGQAVFNSTKASCIACHTIGYVGGKQGPDLTRIGGIRTERDLLESILFPNASFVRSYEPLTVNTKDGKTFNGVPKKDAPDEVILILAADKEVRIPREDIEEVRPGKVSIMPAGLDQQLTPQELADLIAFLRACK